MLLHQQLSNPAEPVFRFAVFFATSLPFSKTTENGIDMSEYFGLSALNRPKTGRPVVMPRGLSIAAQYLRNETELEGKELSDLKDTHYHMFHPTVDTVRIQVPVGHVYGRADPWFRHGVDLGRIC